MINVVSKKGEEVEKNDYLFWVGLEKENYDTTKENFELDDEFKEIVETKGGPGSGSWEAPGRPRFQWQSNSESPMTGHERFRAGAKAGIQMKPDTPKIERYTGQDKRKNISMEGKYHIIIKKKTGDKLYRTIREPDTVEVRVKKKTGEKVKVVVPGQLKFEDGSPIPKTDKKIPPAWTEVYVNKSKKCELQVEGLDKTGEVQPLYSKAHDERRSAEKQARVNESLAPKFKSLYKAVDSDVNKLKGSAKDTAACLRLIMSTGIRPTDENDNPEKRGAKQAFGAITIQGRHVFVNKKNVYIELPAKKGTTYRAEIKDPKIAADLIKRKNKVGNTGRIFDTNETKLLKYSKGKTGYIVKDYRTLKANQEADKIMATMSKPKNEKEFAKAVRTVTKHVSGILCNTPGMAFDSYIDKRKWDAWKKGIKFTEK